MKVAFSVARCGALDAGLDPRFGRAAGFVIVDVGTCECTYVANEQNLNAAQGAGIQAAQLVADRGVDAVVTANCGPKAFRVLDAAGIKVYYGEGGTVGAALAALERGELALADGANAEGHWI